MAVEIQKISKTETGLFQQSSLRGRGKPTRASVAGNVKCTIKKFSIHPYLECIFIYLFPFMFLLPSMSAAFRPNNVSTSAQYFL